MDPIRGDRVTLRPTAPADRGPLKAMRDEPDVIRWWGEQTAEWPGDDDTVEEWTIELDGEIVGFIQFFESPTRTTATPTSTSSSPPACTAKGSAPTRCARSAAT